MIFKIALFIVLGFLLAALLGLFVRSAAKREAAQEEVDPNTKEKGRRELEGSSDSGNGQG